VRGLLFKYVGSLQAFKTKSVFESECDVVCFSQPSQRVMEHHLPALLQKLQAIQGRLSNCRV
jgi:hypothetical protein